MSSPLHAQLMIPALFFVFALCLFLTAEFFGFSFTSPSQACPFPPRLTTMNLTFPAWLLLLLLLRQLKSYLSLSENDLLSASVNGETSIIRVIAGAIAELTHTEVTF